MGYDNLPSAKYPPPKPTEAEAAVAAVKSMEALELMGKLMYNCAVAPREEKYRRIKLSNKKLSEVLAGTPNAVAALKALGWVEDADAPGELVVPPGRYFSMAEVRVVEAAKDKLKKELSRSNSANRLSSLVSVQA